MVPKSLELLDYEDGLVRFVNKPELYHKFLDKFINEPIFEDLKKAMKEGDYQAAFEFAHTMKGNSGNLSLVSLYQYLVPFVEDLRDRTNIPAAIEKFPDVEEVYERTIAYVKKALDKKK